MSNDLRDSMRKCVKAAFVHREDIVVEVITKFCNAGIYWNYDRNYHVHCDP